MPDQTTSPSPSPQAALDYAAVERAAARIAGAAHRTPVTTSRTAQAMALAGRLLGAPVTIVMPQDAPAT